eukprot:1247703-Pyramimonas_sp.AAC.1
MQPLAMCLHRLRSSVFRCGPAFCGGRKKAAAARACPRKWQAQACTTKTDASGGRSKPPRGGFSVTDPPAGPPLALGGHGAAPRA